NAEDLGRAHGSVLVGAGQGDIEREDLVRVPGSGQDRALTDAGLRRVVELIDGGADVRTERAGQRAGEDRSTVGGVGVLRTDLVGVGNEGALGFLEEVEEGMTIEVDPDERAECLARSHHEYILTIVSYPKRFLLDGCRRSGVMST